MELQDLYNKLINKKQPKATENAQENPIQRPGSHKRSQGQT